MKHLSLELLAVLIGTCVTKFVVDEMLERKSSLQIHSVDKES